MKAATGHVLDAGALIALERGHPRMAELLVEARRRGAPMVVPVGALAQVWRGSVRQAVLAKILKMGAVQLVELDGKAARQAGVLCGATRTSDVIDATVVLCAADRGLPIVTSDPDDLRRLDPTAEVIPI